MSEQSVLSKHFKSSYIGEGVPDPQQGEYCSYCAEKLVKTHFMHREDLLQHISFAHVQESIQRLPNTGQWNKVNAVEEVVSLDSYTEEASVPFPTPLCLRHDIPTYAKVTESDPLGHRLYCTKCDAHNEALAQKLQSRPEKAQSSTELFDLTQIPYSALVRLGAIFKEGDVKYGVGNWTKGVGDKQYQLERANHALKHLLIYIHFLRTSEYVGEVTQVLCKCASENVPAPCLECEGTLRLNTQEDDLAKVLWFCSTQCELERLEKAK